MNNKTEYIDKLFAEARKEPLIMSAKEIDEIVRNAAAQPLVPTQKIVPSKFISSIGSKLIISAAAAAIILTGASYLAFREQASSDPIPATNSIEIAKSENIGSSETGLAKSTTAYDSKTDNSHTKNVRKPHNRSYAVIRAIGREDAEQPIQQPITVKGINMVELGASEISNLGIGHGPDGAIEFVAGKNEAFDVRVTLAHGDVDIRNTTHTTGNAVFPKFVTDNVGNRKLSLISNNNINLIKTYSKDASQTGGNSTLSNVYISNYDQSDAPDNRAGMGFSIFRQRRSLISPHGSNINFSFADAANRNESINISINVDSLFDQILENLSREFDLSSNRTSAGRMSLAAIIRNIREGYDGTVEIETETAPAEQAVATTDAAQDTTIYIDFKDLKSKLDSLRIAINSYNYLINLNSSVRSIDFQSIFNTAQTGNRGENFKSKYYPSAIAMRSWQYQADSLMAEMENIENELDAYLRVNKLVPVVVNNAEQSYIFWYEPTAELIDKLPTRYRKVLEPELIALKNSLLDCRLAPHPGEKSYFEVWRACSGAIENLAISPNPVKTVLTASYLLTSERNCSVALHDLRGTKVSELSAMATKPAAQINEQFAISGIAPGLYLLVVSTDNGEQAVQRVIIE